MKWTSATENNPTGQRPGTERPVTKGRGVAALAGRLPRGGRLFGPLLGLLFMAYPVRVLLASNPAPVRLVFAAFGTSLFVGVFLWLLWSREPLRAAAEPSAVRARRAAVASLGALALLLVLVCGREWLMLFAHVSVAAGLMLPRKDALPAVAGLAVASGTLGLASGTGWLEAGQFVLPVVILGLLFAAFARHVATAAELRAAREEIARLAVAEERLRFARDLHDLLGHSLSAIALKSELAARLLPDIPGTRKAAAEVRDIHGVARAALREVREAVVGYRQLALGEELAGAREMLEAAGISCRIENGAGPLPKPVEALLAWVVREGTTNVIRHSRARRCDIRLARQGGKNGEAAEVSAEVSDDGRGPFPARDGAKGSGAEGSGIGSSTGGSGLAGLAERVAAFAGAGFDSGPLPGGGFRLRVSLPLRDGGVNRDVRR
jgi:two-component system sensor histidine kinase DesK